MLKREAGVNAGAVPPLCWGAHHMKPLGDWEGVEE